MKGWHSDTQGMIELDYNDMNYTVKFDQDLSVHQFLEEVIVPMMISMGYSPVNVWEALGMKDELQVTKDYLNKEGVFTYV